MTFYAANISDDAEQSALTPQGDQRRHKAISAGTGRPARARGGPAMTRLLQAQVLVSLVCVIASIVVIVTLI